MFNRIRICLQWGDSGQSLVEAALFLPILIFILAGVVEVSNLLNTQNRVTTASRIAAGYGAANFDPDDWASTASGMGDVAMNTVTETLELQPDLWDVWSIHAVTNNDGNGFDVFTSTHVYGNHSVISAAEWVSQSQQIESEILAELQTVGITNTKNLEIVASIPHHDMDTILGLPIWQWAGLQTVRDVTVMRVGKKPPFTGCPLLPITIRYDQFSLYPTNWPDGLQGDWNRGRFPDDWVDRFPDSFGSQMAVPPDPYLNMATAPTMETNNYSRNVPGVPLQYAKPGYIYWAREQDAPGGFGWLTWRGNPSTTVLDASLDFPGNFTSQTEGYPTSPADMNTVGNGTYGPTGDADGALEPSLSGHVGEWVEGTTGNINIARSRMQQYIDQGRLPSLLVYDYTNDLTGSGLNYHVVGFMKVNILGYKFTSSEKWIVFEIIEWPSQDCIVE